ncbi:MAG: 50S ribosomal protein L4 [Calditrichia bacterium]
MELNVYKMDGTETGDKVELSPAVFEITPNEHVVHLAVKAFLANQRQGTHMVKTRSMVSGGGRKPFRQKGTGRARQGTIRAPHMVGGGVAHGPQPRDYTQTLPKKVKKLARRSVLSARAKDERIYVVDNFTLDAPRTKSVAELIRNLKVNSNKVLIVTSGIDKNLVLSARNIPYVQVQNAPEFSVYALISADYIIFQKDAVDIVNKELAS